MVLIMLQPLYDKILVDTDIEDTDFNDSGLILCEDKSSPRKAKVIAVGQGRPTDNGLQPLLTHVGDIVLVPNFGGMQIFDKDKQYTLIRESDVLGIVS